MLSRSTPSQRVRAAGTSMFPKARSLFWVLSWVLMDGSLGRSTVSQLPAPVSYKGQVATPPAVRDQHCRFQVLSTVRRPLTDGVCTHTTKIAIASSLCRVATAKNWKVILPHQCTSEGLINVQPACKCVVTNGAGLLKNLSPSAVSEDVL